MKIFYIIFIVISLQFLGIDLLIVDECLRFDTDNLDESLLNKLSKEIVPELEGTRKGDVGAIAVIGGSVAHPGPPYFAAISALKVGADFATVITTENEVAVIKSYSPELVVVPHTIMNSTSLYLDVIVIGPGLGRTPEALNLVYEMIKFCKESQKPLVIDADGLYAISKNVQILKDYPRPGAILTPNAVEVNWLKQSVPQNQVPWYKYWGSYVTVLQKGETDMYLSSTGAFDWSLQEGGSDRRTGYQGDILAGALGTFFNWGLKANLCKGAKSSQLAQSVAAYAAAKITRGCNSKAFQIYGRSMIASDMINEIHSAFDDLFS
ncbi:ATP-dependent (S)-NAD(P)H-hydrate dehydratase-like [Maniola hyperantus]|uniref:ATP-dependent (S)-NAD(P)H-hydrate dehydratase-like n=1 Tax=Aphantopus hyperantus TaxID=2795564 RepID=UPI00156A674D|nr:ATP-dependent (S)-NAD(P)H-hydrate dehydratase-like [Maniola hyperantus]